MMPTSQKFQQERKIIGQLLMGYGEMELDLCNCVSIGLDDLDMTLKAMFRARGETLRIDIAEAMGQKVYVSLGLHTAFHGAIESMRFCVKLRNRYAHSHFYDDNSAKLAMISLEEIAKKRCVIKDLSRLTTRYLTTAILRGQEAYFAYTRACIEYVNCEGRFLGGRLTPRIFEAPAKLDRPAEFA